MEEGQGRAPVGVPGECLLPFLGQVMGVDGKFLDPGSETIIKGIFDQRAVKNRDERFGENVGKGAQACAQASSQHKGFLDRGNHGGRGIGQSLQLPLAAGRSLASFRLVAMLLVAFST